MSKYSDLNQFLKSLDALSDVDLNAKIYAMVNADSSRMEMACDKIKGYTEDCLKSKLMCMLYADHVTAELQAENARLNARVAELEKELSLSKNALRLLMAFVEPVLPQLGKITFNACHLNEGMLLAEKVLGEKEGASS